MSSTLQPLLDGDKSSPLLEVNRQHTAIDQLLALVEEDLARTHPGKTIRIRLFGSGPDP